MALTQRLVSPGRRRDSLLVRQANAIAWPRGATLSEEARATWKPVDRKLTAQARTSRSTGTVYEDNELTATNASLSDESELIWYADVPDHSLWWHDNFLRLWRLQDRECFSQSAAAAYEKLSFYVSELGASGSSIPDVLGTDGADAAEVLGVDIRACAKTLAIDLIPIIGPVAALQVLVIAWRIAADVGPEVRTQLIEFLTIVALVVAVSPSFAKLRDRHTENTKTPDVKQCDDDNDGESR
jgi:hypothetical protein